MLPCVPRRLPVRRMRRRSSSPRPDRPSGRWYPLRTKPTGAGASAARGPTSPTGRSCARSCSARRCPRRGPGCSRCSPAPAWPRRSATSAGRRVTCKWPNDLMHREDKVGGILLESAVDDDVLRYVVVGIGVNLQSPADVEGAGGIGERVGMRELLTAFLVRFANTYTTDDASLPERVRHAWLPSRRRSARSCAPPRATVAPSRAGPWASTASARSSCRPTTGVARRLRRDRAPPALRRLTLPRGAR